MNQMIKVAIIDDDVNWTKQLIQYLNNQNHIIVNWFTTNKEDAIGFAKNNTADIILMDINLGAGQEENYDGIFATIEVLEADIKAKVIILTNLRDEDLIINSFIAGAIDFVYKENFKDLPKVLESVFNNLSNPYTVISQEFARSRHNETLQILTLTEKEVFSYLEKRFSQSEIASMLSITQDAVKKHVKNIRKKMEAKSTNEALKNLKYKSLKRRENSKNEGVY